MTLTLREKLIKRGKNKWLDVGCGKNFEEGFYYLDTFPENIIPPEHKEKCFKMDILNSPIERLKNIGKFDLIRMQHVLEHFSYEEGGIVIKKIAKILKKDGYIIITVPDLLINVSKYINGEYKKWKSFKSWATKRVAENAPDSFYFSVFAYSLPITAHKWCYDYVGLEYLLKFSKLFKGIRELKANDPLASFPFTHNRPEEDACLIAKKV